MGSAPISTAFLLASLSTVILMEIVAVDLAGRFDLPRLWLLAAVRILQAAAVCGMAVINRGDLRLIGLARKTLPAGLKKGLCWSAAFAAAAGLIGAGLLVFGVNALALIRTTLPADIGEKVLFFIVGGAVAPVAEEIVFRGVVFGYLRRWGVPTALGVSTALFAAIHAGPALPVAQIVGGVVFAAAYHTEKNLMVPIVIHCLGNLALFTLSLPCFH